MKPKTETSGAAGIMARVEEHRASGPPRVQAACAQACASRRGRARVKRRTVAVGDVSPRLSAFLEVLVELRRPLSCANCRGASSFSCRTEFERPVNVNMRSDGIVAEFEAAHRPNWKSHCEHHRGRPKMPLPSLSAPILSRQLRICLRKRLFPRRRCGKPTGRPDRRTTPSPSRVVRQTRSSPFDAPRFLLWAAHRTAPFFRRPQSRARAARLLADRLHLL